MKMKKNKENSFEYPFNVPDNFIRFSNLFVIDLSLNALIRNKYCITFNPKLLGNYELINPNNPIKSYRNPNY